MSTSIKKSTAFLKKNTLLLTLIIVIGTLVFYLTCNKFRLFLEYRNIDPNFIIGFLTTLALLLSMIQGIKERRYSYNSKITEKVESSGLKIIGKILNVKQKSFLFSNSLKIYKEAMQTKKIYLDINHESARQNFEEGMEMVSAYIQTYFLDLAQDWNILIEKLSTLATIYHNVVENYKDPKNLDLIQKGIKFKNGVLDNLENSIKEAELLNKEIDDLGLEITNKIIERINKDFGKIRNDIF